MAKDTFYRWLREGARLKAYEDKGKKLSALQRRLADFSDAMEKATSEAELQDLATIKQASATSWQAAAWRLERRHPKKYGTQQRIEMSGPDGGAIQQSVETKPDVDLTKLSVDELRAYRSILAKAKTV